MTAPSTSPDTAYYLDQQRVLRAAVDRAQSAWVQLPAGPDTVDVWTEQVRPEVVAAVEQAQADSVALAPLYVAATLAAAGVVSAPLGVLVARAWVGHATTGLPLVALMDFAFRHFRRTLTLGVALSEARTMGLARLLRYVATETADAGRLATTAAAVLEPEIAGYERGVHLPACGRCIQLTGRLYRYSTGFLRHPNCDCTMHPVTRDQWRTGRPANTPRALFDRMTYAQQNKAFGTHAATAIRAGADISRVVNARRHGAVYTAGNHEYTREATTVRGVGGQLGDLAKRGRRYRTTGLARPTPAQLVNATQDESELVRQLRRFGYLR
ncbi:hypothetical protein [Amycolatopsis sp. MtRt-6]|uniref:hypothetical protein n=1 Tax=Amycolatopsis sp. MtRt-6 TaxID=2792782 RepID=UPI001A90C40F|nr:hypothetical protein [Amycolatopsis sp. MtRt-6]